MELIYYLLMETTAEPNMKENTLLALHPTLKYVAVVFYWDKFDFYGLLLPMTSMHPPRQMLMRKTPARKAWGIIAAIKGL